MPCNVLRTKMLDLWFLEPKCSGCGEFCLPSEKSQEGKAAYMGPGNDYRAHFPLFLREDA